MTNTKNTKRALLSSVVALFLCFSMLLGTTFAWFTDSITNGVNKIVSGNLDVELWHKANSKWGLFFGYSEEKGEEVKSDTALFLNQDGDPILWEPGATAVENFRIKNAGSLALKFQFKLEVANATKTEAGKDLSDIIELYIDKLTYDENGVPSGTELVWGRTLDDGYIIEGELLPGENYDFWVGLEWEPSDIDNEYNVKNGLSLDLGVTLLATQLSYEKDDINGNEYDKDAWVEGMVVADESSLKTALRRGETNILLAQDITLTEAIEIPQYSAIALNLNGKTMSADLTKDEGAVLINNGTLTVTGGTLASTAVNGGAVINNKGTMTLDDVIVLGGAMDASGYPEYAITTSGKLTVEDGTQILADRGAIRTSAGAEVVINGGEFVVSDAADGRNMTIHTIYAYGNGAMVTINGGTFVQNHSSTGGASVICPAGAEINIYGGNFSDKMDDSNWQNTANFQNYMGYSAPVNVYGGTYNDKTVQKWVAAGYEAVKNSDGTYTVIFPQNSFDSLIDNAQAGDTVEVPAGTYTFPASKLEAGMTLNCAPGTVFEGAKLNANGATIVGATFSGTASSNTVNGIYKDCTFTGSNGLRYGYVGETAVFENCVFSGDTYGIHFDGGANEVLFKNCTISGFNATAAAVTKVTFDGCTFKANNRSGYNGINLWGNAELTNCTFVFDGSASYEWVDLRGDNKTVTFTNCVVTDGTSETPIENVVGNYGTGNTIIVDGAQLATNTDMLKDAIAAGGNVVLGADVQFAATIKNDAAIDLAGNTFEATGSYNLSNNADFTMTNGDYVVNSTYGHIDVRPDSAEGSVLTFENVDFTSNYKNKTYGTCTDRLVSVIETAPAAGAHIVAVFKNCTFDNAKVLIEGMSGGAGTFEVTFENCTFNALTSSAPIEVMNYMKGTITVKNCTFNLECTSASASAIAVSPSSSTEVTIVAENNTINATAAIASGESGTVEQVKVHGTPANIKFISAYENTTITEINTVKTGIAQ